MQRLAKGEPLRQDEADLLGAIFRREDVLLEAFYDREEEFTRDIPLVVKVVPSY